MNVLSVIGILLAAFLGATAAGADDKADDKPEDPPRHLGPDVSPFVGVDRWRKEIEAAARIRFDPVMRAVVCRVPFMDYTLEALMRATKLSEKEIKRAIRQLEVIQLVTTFRKGGATHVAPADEEAREALRKWAQEWCASDDECGVAK